ncbi:MAG TPA: DEAD/DEAH box helicase [Vicinamibacterales bacterium]|nr:DEAD/DEAH box helicase [Vicinamibacterales bacterium]
MNVRALSEPLEPFHPAVREWFAATFGQPTRPQALGWPRISNGDSTLILAPTGSGKTLAAFLWCLNRLMFSPPPPQRDRCRVLYISPLKALAVDVERNLRAPLDGIAGHAGARGDSMIVPRIAVRTGDTPASERARFGRDPADLLITTPESLYLLLTSNARERLRSIDTVIIDEIHALVPTKRGAHLALSLERLGVLTAAAPQRIGLSATQRPLDEVARFLGGAEERTAGTTRAHADVAERALGREFAAAGTKVRYRHVAIVDAHAPKALRLSIEVPLETELATPAAPPEARGGVKPTSVWAAIHPRLIDLIRSHRSTLIFVNSRRLAERLAGSLNELAGETLVRSHHGSLARTQRTEIEEKLKAGELRALVATSSLELGIDMGAIDLVIQIEAPPSVASGLQRIGRSGHRLDAISEGIVFPKFRGDLVAAAAVVRAMREGKVEATRYPRNPLDIVAQQVVAMTAMDAWPIDLLYATVRRAAPFAELSRNAFEGVLDMLSGRYPSDEFAELRPRITWNRASGIITAREGARRVAVANGGTIPDRGLYGVFLAGAAAGAARVGELDEEMVFESRVGETFVLGASTWRIEEITHDRVLVTPAPGEPGKMPFWKGDQAGRPMELGLAIGELIRDLLALPGAAAIERLVRDHDLDARAAEVLLQYLRDQSSAGSAVPDASTIVVERVRDELGDWRVCVLSPRGGRVHAPWAMAAAARIRERTGVDVETLWGDDGFVVRFPDVDAAPDPMLLLPAADEVEALVVSQLGGTALFAGKFRENAARSLLLPKRRPGMRAPLWQQRKRSADLLAVAARYGSFPVLLETYRECLRDFFDMPALVETLEDVQRKKIRVATVDAEKPSPFAASLLFSYVASFLYDGDAPLAERRAQALVVDQTQLRDLIGDAELRDLLDRSALTGVEAQLQRLEAGYQARSADGIHDLLLTLGDLSERELQARAAIDVAKPVADLIEAGRIVRVAIADDPRLVAVEDAGRFRDALGVDLPPGIPEPLLASVPDPIGDLALRYARTHAPFTPGEFAARYGLQETDAERVLVRLAEARRLVEGEFRPGGTRREWTDANVLRQIRRRSLARLRKQVEPVDPAALGRFSGAWHGVTRRRRGGDALLDVLEQLQGAALPASILETEILPARLDAYDPAELDRLMAGGEVSWVGVESIGERDGRIALYLTDNLPVLLPPRATEAAAADTREGLIIDALRQRGASFFGALHEAAGGGFPDETVKAIWSLVWNGLITNDTFNPLRALTEIRPARKRPHPRELVLGAARSRRLVPPTVEGRWSLIREASRSRKKADATRWATAVAKQLLARYGIVTRENVAAEGLPGGFSLVYPVLKAMEDHGHVRRGYFVSGLGATQFAQPQALDLLRANRDPAVWRDAQPEVVVLAAADPANPYGAALKWPDVTETAGRGPTRSVGATVFLIDGELAGYANRGDRQLAIWIPEEEPARSKASRALAGAVFGRATGDQDPAREAKGMLIETINGIRAAAHPFARFLVEAGFISGASGLGVSLRRFEANDGSLPTAPSA